MTIDSNTLTMAAWAMAANNPLVEAVVNSLIDNGSVMARDIPFANKQTLIANGVRWEGNLPTPNWSELNAEPVAGFGTPTPYQEAAYILRDSIDVDKYLVMDQNAIADPRETQVDAHMKAIAYDFNDLFINNDPLTGNKKKPTGLKYRITNGSTYGVRSENLIDGGGVDVSLSTLTTSTTKDKGNQFIELLDQLIEFVDAPDGSPQVTLYMNATMKRRFRTALRALGTDGGFATTQDQFGRTVSTYKDCRIVDIGRKADQTTFIIPGNGLAGSSAIGELSTGVASTGSSAVYTSIYAVNYGVGHFRGWQFEPLMAHDLGLMNNGSIYRTVVDWAGGLINDSTRSVARLFDIKIA